MKTKLLISCMVIAFTVAGCVEDKFQWSPDGKWMAVSTHDGLRIADANGKLLNVNIPGGIYNARWFPDSKHLLVCKGMDVAKWDELTHYLTSAEAQAVVEAAQRVRPAILNYDWSKGADWGKFEADYLKGPESAKEDGPLFHDESGAVGMYVRDHDDGTLRDFLPPLRWSELEDLKQGVHFVMVYAFDPSGATAGPQLMVSLTQPDCVRVSPTGRAAIIVIPTNLGSATGTVEQLWVAPTDGSKPAVLISSNVAANPDWSADGRDVVFVRGVEDNKLLATLRRVRVIGDNGQIAAQGYDDLAGLLFDSGTRVRCLGDGRIIFSSVEVTLPATPDDVGQRVELFAVEPGKQATVSRLLTSKALAEVGDSAQYFEASPDGSRVSIPDRTGTVDVVDLATGAVTPVQDKAFPKPAQGDSALSAVPTWRGNDELTFVAPGENDRPQVMLWSLSGKKGEVLSATWPSTITDELAPKPAGH